MKKILLSVLLCTVVLLFNSSIVCTEDKVEYIKQTFNPHMKEFMQRTKLKTVGIHQVHLSLIDEFDSKLHYYLIMQIDTRMVIRELYASHQIELDGNRKMICTEGIRIDIQTGKYKYFIDSYIIHRDKNCEKEVIQPIEIWDKILDHFFK